MGLVHEQTRGQESCATVPSKQQLSGEIKFVQTKAPPVSNHYCTCRTSKLASHNLLVKNSTGFKAAARSTRMTHSSLAGTVRSLNMSEQDVSTSLTLKKLFSIGILEF
jgi:hypothetical protein